MPLLAWLALQAPSELLAPFRAEAGGVPIDVAGGNAAPAFHDLDGDGLLELLVGQFEDGTIRVHRNTGARGAPRFAAHTWLRAGEELARVPYG